MITGLVPLSVFRVCRLFTHVVLWCLVTTPGAFGQLPEFTGKKKSSSLPLQTHGCLTSFKCHLHVDVIHSNYSPTIIFIWHCRRILMKLKMLSSTQLCNAKAFMVDRDNLCCIAHTSVCVSSKIWSFHRLLGSNQTQTRLLFLVTFWECSFSPPPTEKLQGTAIKVSTSTTYWNSFPALCLPLSMEDSGSWVYLFTAINLVCACQGHFSVPMQVNLVKVNPHKACCCDNGHSFLLFFLVCLTNKAIII